MYIRFDSIEISSLTDLQLYTRLNKIIKGKTKFLLLDEIQIRKNWDVILKNLYDDFVVENKVKVVATGSSSLTFERKDLGVDRTQKVLISTLDFNEYLAISKKQKTIDEFENFLNKGAYPEYANKNLTFEELKIRTLEPILNEDIPSEYNISVGNITRILLEIASLTNGEFIKSKSSKNTGIAIAQIDNYLDILEKTQIIKRVYQVNEKGQMKRYAKFKVYINPHFHIWLLDKPFNNLDPKAKGHVVESYWLFAISQIDGYYKKFYYMKHSKTNKEIDFVTFDSSNQEQVFGTLNEFKYKKNITNSEIQLLIDTNASNKFVWGISKFESDFVDFKNIMEFKNPWYKKFLKKK